MAAGVAPPPLKVCYPCHGLVYLHLRGLKLLHELVELLRPDTIQLGLQHLHPAQGPVAPPLRFLELLRERGQVCSQIRSFTLAYFFTATAAGDGTLEPVWRIVTETGDFYLNAITGASVDNVG